jgi:putative acetyltransferase
MMKMLKGLTGSPTRASTGHFSVTCDSTLAFKRQSTRCKSDMNIVIRNEIKSDVKAISEITKAAFENLPISNHTEQFIINALRDSNALTISLVAVAGKKVVGHIAFSPVTISDGSPGWYGLGPISVLPELQKQSIGKSLICEGLSSLKSLGAKGCVLVGDPGYYERFGFRSLPNLVIDGVPQENVLALPFGENKARGVVTFHAGFTANS